MITNYLKELLNDNECVIVPGFGAFISKRHSATIDYANHRFMPPYKEIVFNNKLNGNDDILADFISMKEKISKEDALEKIRNFVNQSVAILDVDFKLELSDFGKLININGNYIFNAKEDVNVLGDSFGLTDFNYQPVFRTETYQIIKEKIIVEQKEKNTEYTMAIESVEEVTPQAVRRKPSMFKTLAYTVVAFFLIFVMNWTTDKSDSNLASWNPFLYSSPNEFVIRTLELQNSRTLEIQEVETSGIQEVGNSGIQEVGNSGVQEFGISGIQEVGDSEVQFVPEIMNSNELEIHYYIIGGSFQTEASAEKCLDVIKNQGFEKASTLDKNDKGYIRVYYESFAEKADALVRLEQIKSEHNESAWLLFQK